MKINTNRPKIKACPICGSMPIMRVNDMGRPDGRGYPGGLSYTLSCDCCKLPHPGSSTTIYTAPNKVEEVCINRWNSEVDRIQAFLDNK